MGSDKKKEEHFKLSRRSFLKASGVTGITLLAAGMVKNDAKLFENPQTPETNDTEGVVSEKWINTSCLNCPARCGTSVRVVNGKAVRITGNKLSQVSEGEICPRGHIGLQVLYDTARINSPKKRTNPEKGRQNDPGWVDISWDEALTEISERLQNIRNAGSPEQVAVFKGLNTRSDEDLISRFTQAYGTPNLISGDTLENEAERVGRWFADGNYSHIAYDLEKTNYILAFGASIVESERPLARNLRMWGKMRRERALRAKVIVIDPRYSVTAAKADRWIPIKPGTDGALAMAIANVIIDEGLYDKEFINSHSSGFDSFTAAIAKYTPEKAAGETGINTETIIQIAREFASTKPAIAWVGRGAAGWPEGSMTCYAIYCLNALVGSINVPGGIIFQEDPEYREMPEVDLDDVAIESQNKEHLDRRKPGYSESQISANLAAMNIANSQPYPVKMAIGLNANFIMTAPSSKTWDEALKKIEYYVHISPFINEMALFADIVLPAATFLEQWGYEHSPAGSGFAEIRIKQPVIDTKSEVQSTGDIIFSLASQTGGSVAAAFKDIGDNTEGFVRFRTGDKESWEEFVSKGVWIGPAYQYGQYQRVLKTKSKSFEFTSDTLEELEKYSSIVNQYPGTPRYAPVYYGDESEYPYVMTTYQPLLTMENGSQNYPWAQEISLVMHGVGWATLAEINAETAHRLHIKDGDEVWVESTKGKLKLKARVTEWVHPEVIAIARGQGHYASGKWQKDIGVNPNDIAEFGNEPLSGQAALYNTRVKIYRA
jgi:thiosulfate reductase / polysulfide reductase chain A